MLQRTRRGGWTGWSAPRARGNCTRRAPDVRIYRWLLWLSPPSWRREYGGAMEETFALRIVDARAAGIRGRARLWRRELVSLVALAITERWASRRVRALDTEGKAQRMDAMAQEIRHAARRLRRSPAFTVAAVLTLALAIGANASIFAVVHRVLLNPLPYGDPERLIALDYAVPGQNVPSGLTSMSWQLYHQLSDHARTLEGVAAYDTGDITVTGNGDPERIRVSHATPSLAPTRRRLHSRSPRSPSGSRPGPRGRPPRFSSSLRAWLGCVTAPRWPMRAVRSRTSLGRCLACRPISAESRQRRFR